MASARTIVATATVLLILASAISQSTGQQQTVTSCQQQCYQTYLRLYQYYCKWGTICNYTDYLAQFYMSCYKNCNSYRPTTTTTTTTTTRRPWSQGSQQSSCGVSPVGRIVGGTQASDCEFPWAVVINIGSTFCGGSIVDSNTVVTAAHCVYTTSGGVTNSNRVTVKYGSSNQQWTKIAYVTRVTVHPNFILRYYDYDVAILTLDRYLEFDRCTSAICLPNAEADAFATEGCIAAGWGALQYSNPSAQTNLQKVRLPIVPLNQCQAAFRDTRLISDIKICAGDLRNGGIDSCLGDSGGPLMCSYNGVYYLFGVVSFGRGCATPGYPGVYARVTHTGINNWIRSNM
ncbi:chymotrypsinogen A-like isoform X2 [Littorina saxatilis]|uniref:Peptidase S1 domain-containing protein n=1 Tax=Littorina saxatilis TaxID=31220 RepID=A0AAN9BYN3_9CAEN